MPSRGKLAKRIIDKIANKYRDSADRSDHVLGRKSH